MQFESLASERRGTNRKPPGSSLETALLCKSGPVEATLWKQRHVVTKQARVTLKWKMQTLDVTSRATAKVKNVPPTPSPPSYRSAWVYWRVLLHRQCDHYGTVDSEVARGRTVLSGLKPGSELYSALAYCDQGDALSIVVSIAADEGAYHPEKQSVDAVKVVGKEFVVLPHPVRAEYEILVPATAWPVNTTTVRRCS
jgi:hypothetical protein